VAIGSAVGLVLAGVVLDHLSWRFIFVIGAVAVGLAAALVHLLVPESPVKTPAGLDLAGALLLSLTLVALLLALTNAASWGWTSAGVLGLLAAAVLLLLAWVAVERSSAAPIVDLRTLADRTVLLTNLCTLLLGVPTFATFMLVIDFIQAPEPSRATINSWVSDRTAGLIPELMGQGSITSLTRFVLTNTVYFKADWATQFLPEMTHDGAFTKTDGTTVTAKIMHEETSLAYAKGANYQAVALPYTNDAVQFLAILPDAEKLTEVESALSPTWLAALRTSLSNREVSLGLPKLDYKTSETLNDELIALGMPTAFSGSADFSGISSEGLQITKVVHQATIQVDEKGTVASAATGVGVGATAAHLDVVYLTFDRPYFVAILDAPTGAVLFLGRVLDPTAK